MALVSGYDSDSDSGGESSSTTKVKTSQKLSSLLPPPSSSQSKEGGSLELPAVKSSSDAKSTLKRRPEKRQVRIHTLSSLPDEDADDSIVKRAKVEAGRNGGGGGLHGLLGMLPAPKHADQPGPVKQKGVEESTINKMGLTDGSEGRLKLDDTATKKIKGNNDFRAMLGLKSSSLPAKTKTIVDDTPALSSATSALKPATNALTQGEAVITAKKGVNADFFMLGDLSSHSSSHNFKPAFSVSTAPIIEGEKEEEERQQAIQQNALLEEQYKGWQQGMDGNWFPVTPEAHAAYNHYLSAQANASQGGDHVTDRPADMQYGDIDTIQSVDANASSDAWQSRPTSQVDSATTELDRKYALAAASMAMPDQGVPLVDQEEEEKKMDKRTNFRARRKGQLSSLISQAEENRERLEERWSKGKDGRNTAKAKYGF